MTDKLPEKFTGIGEVKGFEFVRVDENEEGYIYKVTTMGRSYFEVFKKRRVKKAIDFKKRIYSETEFKEVYPKSNAFGSWAFTFRVYAGAKNMLNRFLLASKHAR